MKKGLTTRQLYAELRSHFGFLDWWPGETIDEIIIGTILTQNTSWKNVEKAIINLKHTKMLELNKVAKVRLDKLETLIRPSGFYRQKAKCLRNFASYVTNNYVSIKEFFKKNTHELRKELISLNGIGKETADSILLYAAEKPVFVIDAYTKRTIGRIYGISEKNLDYDSLQSWIEGSIKRDVELYKDFHAQFVELAKRYCRKEPICKECQLNNMCFYGREMLVRNNIQK